MKKTLLMVRGIPSSGKTTLAKTIVELINNLSFNASLQDNAVMFAADDFFEKDGKYEFDASLLGKAHNMCKENTRKALKNGIEFVIVSNTSTTESELEPYIKMAKEHNYNFTSIIVESRHGNMNEHNVPPSKIEEMKKKIFNKIVKINRKKSLMNNSNIDKLLSKKSLEKMLGIEIERHKCTIKMDNDELTSIDIKIFIKKNVEKFEHSVIIRSNGEIKIK